MSAGARWEARSARRGASAPPARLASPKPYRSSSRVTSVTISAFAEQVDASQRSPEDVEELLCRCPAAALPLLVLLGGEAIIVAMQPARQRALDQRSQSSSLGRRRHEIAGQKPLDVVAVALQHALQHVSELVRAVVDLHAVDDLQPLGASRACGKPEEPFGGIDVDRLEIQVRVGGRKAVGVGTGQRDEQVPPSAPPPPPGRSSGDPGLSPGQASLAPRESSALPHPGRPGRRRVATQRTRDDRGRDARATSSAIRRSSASAAPKSGCSGQLAPVSRALQLLRERLGLGEHLSSATAPRLMDSSRSRVAPVASKTVCPSPKPADRQVHQPEKVVGVLWPQLPWPRAAADPRSGRTVTSDWKSLAAISPWSESERYSCLM